MTTLSYTVNAIDSASGTFKRIGVSADSLDRQLADLSKRVATPGVDLGDKPFAVKMADAAVKINRLSEKIANPKVQVDTAKAQLDILKLTAELDKIAREHVTADVGIKEVTPQTGKIRQAFATLDNMLSRDAATRLRSGAQGSVLGTLNSLFSPHPVSGAPTPGQSAASGLLGKMVTGGSGSGGSGSGGSFAGNLAGGIGPSILGLGAKATGIVGLAGSAVATLPALAGTAGLGAGVALIGGMVAGVVKNSPLLKTQLKGIGADADTMFKTIGQPIIPALHDAFAQIPVLMKQVTPALTGLMKTVAPQIGGIISGLGPVITGLVKVMQAAAPAFGPVIESIEKLVANILPGLQVVIKAMIPFLDQFAKIFENLGSQLGGFFSAAAPAIGASMKILSALLDVVGGLLPVLVKLGGVFATVLAPVFTSFAGIVRALEPFIVDLGKIFAALAGAVLGDLAGAFGALATLLKGIAPSLGLFTTVIGQVFKELENSGVFAVLGDALEKLATPLANLINALVSGIAPVLPLVVGLFGKLLSVLTGGVTAALGGVASALAAVVRAIPAPVLQAITVGLLALWAGFKGAAIITSVTKAVEAFATGSVYAAARSVVAWVSATVPIVASFVAQAAAATAAFIAENVATLGIIAGITALVAGAVYLATHWQQVWGDVKKWAEDAWNFIWNGFGKYLLPLLGPVGLIALGAIEVAKHWATVCNLIQGSAQDLWNWLWNDFGAKLLGFFTKTIPGWWDQFNNLANSDLIKPFQAGLQDLWNWVWNDFGAKIENFFIRTLPGWFGTAVTAIGKVWSAVENVIKTPVDWVASHILAPLASGFDFITSHLGLGNPLAGAVRTFQGMAGGGLIPGFGGGDRHLRLLEAGEAVVDKDRTRQHAGLLRAIGVPGMATGGIVGNPPPGRFDLPGTSGPAFGPFEGFFKGAYSMGRISAAIATGNTKALTNALSALIGHGAGGAGADLAKMLVTMPAVLIKDAVNWLISNGGVGGGSGAAIVDYAKTYLGKIPYVFGGTSLTAGDDCSGFTQAIYRHFGYNAPRTSEQQGAWVKKAAPTAGGLVFFNSPAGGPPPGHVGIVINGRQMISQAGPEGVLGPTIGGIAGNMFAGIPPSGFAKTAMGAKGLYTLPGLESLWDSVGGPGGNIAHIAGAIALAESGGRPNAFNASGASGLWQILGSVVPGNLFNPVINAENAVKKYKDAGGNFSPWVTYETGAYRQYMDQGGWLRPGWNPPLYNGTGRLEPIGPAAPASGPTVTLIIKTGPGANALDRAVVDIVRKSVRVDGGGDVQLALGSS